jgi:hypothetical protein
VGVFLSRSRRSWAWYATTRRARAALEARRAINGVGSFATAIVTIIIASTKFTEVPGSRSS